MTANRTLLPRLALLAPVALLPACGYSLERTERVQGLERNLAESETRSRELTTRIEALERTLAEERRARGELATVERRLARAQAELGSAQRGDPRLGRCDLAAQRAEAPFLPIHLFPHPG